MRTLGVRVDPELVVELDRIAAEHRWTRSQAGRYLLELGLGKWDGLPTPEPWDGPPVDF